jgi:uncharacterized membrane protein YjdF
MKIDRMVRRLELPLAALLFIAGSAYLLKMAYMPVLLVTVCGALMLFAFYFYLRLRYQIKIPLIFIVMLICAIEVDGLGNYFRMYGQRFGPIMYDEFSHLAVQILTTPLLVWILREAINRFGYRLPLGLITFFSITTVFSISAFYEVIELWDELYFRGQRIWSTHDAPNDLQWDLLGIITGAIIAHFVLKRAVQLRPDAP